MPVSPPLVPLPCRQPPALPLAAPSELPPALLWAPAYRGGASKGKEARVGRVEVEAAGAWELTVAGAS